MTEDQAKRVKDIRGKFAVSELQFCVASWLDVDCLLQLVDDLCGQLKEEMAEYATALEEHTVQLTVQVAKARREDAEIVDVLSKEFRQNAKDSFDKKDYSTASAWECWMKAATKVKQAIEAKAKEDAGG